MVAGHLKDQKRITGWRMIVILQRQAAKRGIILSNKSLKGFKSV
jgi:hypothetical protein